MSTEIMKPTDMMTDLVKSQSKGFIPGIRIASGTSDVVNDPESGIRVGEFYCNKDSLGREFKAVIGPWRYHALRMKENKIDLESFCITPNSRFNPEKNEWLHPDGFTPNFKEIKDKKIPDDGMKLTNMAGFDVLLYLPDHNLYGFFFIAKTALTMPKPEVFPTCQANPNRLMYWRAEKAPSTKYTWYIPQVRLSTDPVEHQWDQEVIEKFLNPGLIDVIAPTSGRPA